MNTTVIKNANDVVEVLRPSATSPVVLVCEHASFEIPVELNGLGVAAQDRKSHAAWDPGALTIAQNISLRFDATLVASKVSRLVYDCNRPPNAPDAMPAKSELIDVPGNAGLNDDQKQARVDNYYRPFQQRLANIIADTSDPVVLTVHSFTPIYHGQSRAVEIGILHDADTRLADAMLDAAKGSRFDVQRNAPYGPKDGVTHTLQEHGVAHGHLNVMIEVRNDLLASPTAIDEIAQILGDWLEVALSKLKVTGQAA